MARLAHTELPWVTGSSDGERTSVVAAKLHGTSRRMNSSARDERSMVIVGAGQTGARAAATLRDAGWHGRIVLFGDEALPPYERPPLSKSVLTGESRPTDALIAEPDFYRANRIELRTASPVVAILPDRAQVVAADGRVEAYHRLLVATGADARRLTLPGSNLPGVHYLRTAAQAQSLRSALLQATQVILIGGGPVGLEIAASVTKIGGRATVIEAAPHLMGRILPTELGEYLTAVHEAHGVRILTGVTVNAITGDSRATGVRTSAGANLSADVVVIGVGAEPNVALARAAGLVCRDGVVVNDLLRTSDDAIFAAGDAVARLDAVSGSYVRVESWHNAESQAVVAANNMTGGRTHYETVPWFWTDQHGINLQVLGQPLAADHRRIYGRIDQHRFCVLYQQGGQLVAAALVNAGRHRRTLARLIATRAALDEAALVQDFQYLQ